MEVLMRRSMTWLAAALSFAVACSGDTVSVGTRSDGVIVYCNIGEYYYVCTPEYPQDGNPPSGEGGGGDGSDGEGSGTTSCNPDTYPCPGSDGGGSNDEGEGGGGGGGDCGGGDGVGGDGGGWNPAGNRHPSSRAEWVPCEGCGGGDACADDTSTDNTRVVTETVLSRR
jgi:hypothetical protein